MGPPTTRSIPRETGISPMGDGLGHLPRWKEIPDSRVGLWYPPYVSVENVAKDQQQGRFLRVV